MTFGRRRIPEPLRQNICTRTGLVDDGIVAHFLNASTYFAHILILFKKIHPVITSTDVVVVSALQYNAQKWYYDNSSDYMSPRTYDLSRNNVRSYCVRQVRIFFFYYTFII